MSSLETLSRKASAMDDAILAANIRARELTAKQVRDGADYYDRARDLPRLMNITPEALTDTSRRGTLEIIDRLNAGLRGEQNAIRTGHWSRAGGTGRAVRYQSAIMAEERALVSLLAEAA